MKASRQESDDDVGVRYAHPNLCGLTENGGKCNHCGAADATVGDHVKPLKAFADDVNSGTMTKADAVRQAHAPDNVVGSCAACNGQKGAKELSSTPGQGKYVPPNPSDRIKEKL